ncbi:MAG: histone [Candidatus Altiarchaeales archaeon]|nr:MAG: histone [Candidatus Altiarchaeales archaeon]RLI94236.1 MAG: histone [Candidatus Altiarchaeales archaeon]HDO81884.1 histone family protein [Candidatus Altiarchaeales archaeon]HEX54533.1 histone family protein [Candidatus Altiarchaeales archaeon]
MAELPLAPIERIIRRSGGDIRVSEDATMALRDILEEKAVEIAERAAKLARHAGRKTIKASDIKLAK